MDDRNYAGFWIRTGAALIDSVAILLLIAPVLTVVYGKGYWFDNSLYQGVWDIVLNFIFPAVAVVLFWLYRSATPGKMLTRLVIIDAQTGKKPTTGQFIIRYLGYYVSMLPLFLGIFWVGIDKRKQGFHDKMADTVVIRENPPESKSA